MLRARYGGLATGALVQVVVGVTGVVSPLRSAFVNATKGLTAGRNASACGYVFQAFTQIVLIGGICGDDLL